MGNFLRKMLKILHLIEEILMLAPVVLIFILVTCQVFARYIFQIGIMWSDELVSFLMVFLGMFGAVIAVRKKAHIDMTSFIEKAPKSLALLMKIMQHIFIIGFLCFLVIAGILFADSAVTQKSTMLGISMAIPYSLMPVGAFLMLLEYILLNLGITEPSSSVDTAENYV